MYQEASDNTSNGNGERILRASSTIHQKNSGADTEFGRKVMRYVWIMYNMLYVRCLLDIYRDVPWAGIYLSGVWEGLGRLTIYRPITEDHINGYSLTKKYKVKKPASQDKTVRSRTKQKRSPWMKSEWYPRWVCVKSQPVSVNYAFYVYKLTALGPVVDARNQCDIRISPKITEVMLGRKSYTQSKLL